MQSSLALTAVLMGLAGGPHCVAMCGAACAGLGQAAGTRQVQALRIDGLAPYSFALLPEGVSTAIDNERIEIDLRALTWRSDFRGQASGQGRCERSDG